MPHQNLPKELEEEFEREFVKDLGDKIEPVWLDPNGCVGPVRQFIAKVYTTARRQALTEGIEALPQPWTMEAHGCMGCQICAAPRITESYRAEAIAKLTQLRDV